MNAIQPIQVVKARGVILPRRVPPCPPVSARLRTAIGIVQKPHIDVPYKAVPDLREEAVRALADLAPLLVPAADKALLEAFLWPVADAVEFVPEEDVFFRRVNVTFMATQHMPHVAWTQHASMALCRTAGRNLPSVQQIIEAVWPAVEPLTHRHRALSDIADHERYMELLSKANGEDALT